MTEKYVLVVSPDQTHPDLIQIAGQFLASFDPDAHGGVGKGEFTLDPTHAKLFDTVEAASAFWGQESKVMPVRRDGQPNRPLTCTTFGVMALSDAKEYAATFRRVPKVNLVMGSGADTIALLSALAGKPLDPCEIADKIEREPDIKGKAGRAWLCDLAKGRAIKNIDLKDDGEVCRWIIECPGAHPAWHSYAMTCIHLRPMPDGRETKFYLPDATHEFVLFAMDPGKPRNPMVETGLGEAMVLHPANFGAQFIEVSDEGAMWRMRDTVRRICEGELNPDTDFRQQWIRLFGDNMMLDRPGRDEPEVRHERQH